MTREDLKELKYSIQWVKEQINKYKEQRELVLSLSQNLDGMPKAQNKPNYALESLLDSYNELLEILKKEQDKINDTYKQLMKLKPIHKSILTKRYIEGKDFEEIATEIHYDYYNTCKIHGKALNEFDKLDNTTKKDQDLPKKTVYNSSIENL